MHKPVFIAFPFLLNHSLVYSVLYFNYIIFEDPHYEYDVKR